MDDPSLVVVEPPIEAEEPSRHRVVEEAVQELKTVLNQALHNFLTLNNTFLAAVFVAIFIGGYSTKYSVENCSNHISPEFGRNLWTCVILAVELFPASWLIAKTGESYLELHLELVADITHIRPRRRWVCTLVMVLIFLAIVQAGLLIASFVIIIQINALGCGGSSRLSAAAVFMAVLTALTLLFYLYFIVSDLLLAWKNGRRQDGGAG